MERRKLFSSPAKSDTPTRRKLFSSNQSGVTVPQIKKVICQDCGFMMDTLETTATLYCPKCGGTRFNVLDSSVVKDAGDTQKEFSEEPKPVRRSLFGNLEQKEFSEASNKLEEALKLYSGKELTDSEVEKNFSETGYNKDLLIEKGFASTIGDDKIKILDTAFLQSKLFSKLTISITKELDLDPMEDCCRGDIIRELGNSGSISPKGIMLIRKAHTVPLMREANFSEDIMDEWAVDSGVLNDIRLEFGGQNMSIPEFMEIINCRYDDAPGDVLEYLIEKGILIPRDGDRLDIRK